jgi:hypothetical protein
VFELCNFYLMLHWPLTSEQVKEGAKKRFLECLDLLKKRQNETKDKYQTPWFQVQEKCNRDSWSKHLVTHVLNFSLKIESLKKFILRQSYYLRLKNLWAARRASEHSGQRFEIGCKIIKFFKHSQHFFRNGQKPLKS